MGDKNDRRKETIKERIAKKKQAGKRIAKKALHGCTCGERKARSKEMPANNYQDHPSTGSPTFSPLSLSISLSSLLNLRLLFLSVSDIFSRRGTGVVSGKGDNKEEDNGDELGMTKRWKEMLVKASLYTGILVKL